MLSASAAPSAAGFTGVMSRAALYVEARYGPGGTRRSPGGRERRGYLSRDSLARQDTRTVSGSLNLTRTMAPGPRRTSFPRVDNTTAVPAPPPAAAPMAAPFFPSAN